MKVQMQFSLANCFEVCFLKTLKDLQYNYSLGMPEHNLTIINFNIRVVVNNWEFINLSTFFSVNLTCTVCYVKDTKPLF